MSTDDVQVLDNRKEGSWENRLVAAGKVVNVDSNADFLFLDLRTGFTIVIAKIVLQKEIVLERLRE